MMWKTRVFWMGFWKGFSLDFWPKRIPKPRYYLLGNNPTIGRLILLWVYVFTISFWFTYASGVGL